VGDANGAKTPRSIAIACQGGGSHTAFTGGVLQALLRHDDSRITALSGTSGGAACAYIAWSALLETNPDARENAAKRLQTYWDAVKPQSLLAELLDDLFVDTLRAYGSVGIVLEASPYLSPLTNLTTKNFLDDLRTAVPEPSASLPEKAPRLLVSAADVNSGEFRIFRSHQIGATPADPITSEVIRASAAVPTIFRAAHLDGHLYWDGLFALNPPVRDLPDAGRGCDNHGRPPDEIWVIMINPVRHQGEPTRMDDIRDRRNELSANISLQQEISFLGKINELKICGQLASNAAKKYQPIKVRVITMADDVAAELDYESKLSTSPRTIDRLMEHGRDRAVEFLLDLQRPDADDRTALPLHDIWGRRKDWDWYALTEK
jgi:NTE family protein